MAKKAAENPPQKTSEAKKKPVDGNEFRLVKLAKKKQLFIEAYRRCGVIRYASEATKVQRSLHYKWLECDEAYAQAFAEAQEDAIDAMEKEAFRRAVKGTLKPVFHQGEECGQVREYSDTLLIFLMKGARPHKYRDNVNVSGTVNHEHKGEVRIIEDGDWYGNANRLTAEAIIPHGSGATLSLSVQAPDVRETVGENGNDNDRLLEGARVLPGPVQGGD